MHNWYHSSISGIPYIHGFDYNVHYTWRTPLAFYLPSLIPLCSPFDPLLLTWNPPSCDRIRPPRSQVACKLTSPVPTLYPNPPPSKFPEPQLPSASLRRPQVESGVFCLEHLYLADWKWGFCARVEKNTIVPAFNQPSITPHSKRSSTRSPVRSNRGRD